jgi:two-component system sensor histidine kinase DctS
MAFVLFVVVVGALLWLYDRTERDEQRANLISDVLWLEQDLRFQFTRNEEILGQIGPRLAASPESFEAQAGTLLANKAGLRQVIWVDAANRVRRVYPGSIEGTTVGEVQDAIPAPETLRLARSLGSAAYSSAYPIVDGDWQFEVHVPVFHDGAIVGVAIGVYSIRRILDDAIPWWLAERYRIGIVDTSGGRLGDRSKVEVADESNSYQIPFEPPGHGLMLQTIPYRTPAPLAGRLLAASLVLLAMIVLLSLWALRRHVQQRLVAEEALRNEYAFRKAMEDSLQTGMRALGFDGCISYVNPAFCRMVGYAAEELLGCRAPQPYWPPEEHENIARALAAARSTLQPSGGIEIRLQRRNGERFDALLYEAPLIDAEGRHTGWMGAVLDITERKRNRELVRQQEEKLAATARLVAMGEMASSLAHELNQPLAAIASYNAGCANMIASGKADMAELRTALEKSAEQARRAGRIIRRIYEFVRRSEPKSEPCDLAEIVGEVLALVEADARHHGVDIRRSIAAPLPPLNGDRVLITQALLNLVRNAIEAMRGVGRDRRLLTVTTTTDAESIIVAIADTGCGIPAEAAARLFEPFFTTKTEGMGMGLNICRSVIEAHHGRLVYAAAPDGGCIFQAQFPLSLVAYP